MVTTIIPKRKTRENASSQAPDGFFGGPSKPPPEGSRYFSLGMEGEWEEIRDSHTPPRYSSGYDGSEQHRAEFIEGAKALGFFGDGPRPLALKPQQMVIADACNASDSHGEFVNTFMAVIVPRRASKTTTIQALAIGRCLSRPGYLVAFTFATTGSKVRQRFLADVFPVLERTFPDEATRPFRLTRGADATQIIFHNGSRLLIVPPKADAFRSEAFDLIVIDEAGSADVAMGEDLVTGILPTMDTRDAQMIVAGTAARYRKGNLLWDYLEDGRNGDPDTGIVEYSAEEGLTADDIDTWDKVLPILIESHPGIGTLAPLRKIETNYHKFSRAKFLAEYLSIFGDTGSAQGLITADKWAVLAEKGPLPKPPAHFALGVAVSPGQDFGAIVAAWRDDDGKACVLLLDHQAGVAWIGPRIRELQLKYKVKVGHDTFGPILAEVGPLQLSRGQIRAALTPQKMSDVTTGAATFVREVETRNLRQFDQDDLTSAVLLGIRRKIGQGGAWGFGRKDLDDDITALEAGSIALRVYDQNPKRQRIGVIVGTAA